MFVQQSVSAYGDFSRLFIGLLGFCSGIPGRCTKHPANLELTMKMHNVET